MIGKLTDKDTAALNKKNIALINRDPVRFKIIADDNGTEFHRYK